MWVSIRVIWNERSWAKQNVCDKWYLVAILRICKKTTSCDLPYITSKISGNWSYKIITTTTQITTSIYRTCIEEWMIKKDVKRKMIKYNKILLGTYQRKHIFQMLKMRQKLHHKRLQARHFILCNSFIPSTLWNAFQNDFQMVILA